MIESSTFVRNYVGLDGTILKVIGFPIIQISTLVFSWNGNWNPDIYASIS